MNEPPQLPAAGSAQIDHFKDKDVAQGTSSRLGDARATFLCPFKMFVGSHMQP